MDSRYGIIGPGRLDFERLRAGADRLQPGHGAAMSDALPSFLGQVVSTGSNLRADRFCKVVPAAVLGTESEGQAGIFAGGAATGSANPVFVYLMGSFLPSTGDLLVCRRRATTWAAASSTTAGWPS